MGNWISVVALAAWPLVSILLYSRRPLSQATLWTVLAAQMLLPVGAVIKFQMIPQFDKETIPCLCILAGCMIVTGRRLKLFHESRVPNLLIVMFLIAPLITSQLNGDLLMYGDRIVPGVGWYDAISAFELNFIALIPFLVGRQFLRHELVCREIMVILVLAGLVYSLPLLFEIRSRLNSRIGSMAFRRACSRSRFVREDTGPWYSWGMGLWQRCF